MALSQKMPEVMLSWISMYAVPSWVPLHVMFTQNSANRRQLTPLTTTEFVGRLMTQELLNSLSLFGKPAITNVAGIEKFVSEQLRQL